MPVNNGATAALRQLGAPEELRGNAGINLPAPDLTNNAHVHLPPNFSAFDTIAQAVDLAADQGVRIFGASNYYDYNVYRDFAELAAQRGVFPVFGLEIITLIEDLQRDGIKINDPGNPGKMYVCGKGITRFDPLNEEATALLEVIRRNDSERMARMVARIAELLTAKGLETGLNEQTVKERIAHRHGSPLHTVFLQERHVAMAFQEALFELVPAPSRAEVLEAVFGGTPSKAPHDAVTVQGEIRSHLMKAGKPGYVEETFVDFDHAYRLILALGGIPCYPTLADGASPICPYEVPVERLVEDLRNRGLFAAELIPIRNRPDVLAQYVQAMRRAGLIVTAGTEHNTLDLLPIKPACLNGDSIPEDVQAIFREGACVVAAHQYLTANGLPGFVDEQGQPNAAYATDEERIAAFAALGAEVIRRYQEVYPSADGGPAKP